jgi:hypothetical protein
MPRAGMSWYWSEKCMTAHRRQLGWRSKLPDLPLPSSLAKRISGLRESGQRKMAIDHNAKKI